MYYQVSGKRIWGSSRAAGNIISTAFIFLVKIAREISIRSIHSWVLKHRKVLIFCVLLEMDQSHDFAHSIFSPWLVIVSTTQIVHVASTSPGHLYFRAVDWGILRWYCNLYLLFFFPFLGGTDYDKHCSHCVIQNTALYVEFQSQKETNIYIYVSMYIYSIKDILASAIKGTTKKMKTPSKSRNNYFFFTFWTQGKGEVSSLDDCVFLAEV